MLEIELFYKTVEAKLRAKHNSYLEREKLVAVELELPKVEELPKGEAWRELNFIQRFALKRNRKKQLKAYKKALKKQRELRVEDKLLRGYNAGVKMALAVLDNEYSRYDKRLKKESKKGVS